MPKRKPTRRTPKPSLSPTLKWILSLTLVSQILLSVWGFVHIGSSGPTRYPDWGAELLCVLAAVTAGFTWLTIKLQRIGVYGMLSGLLLLALFLFTNRPQNPAALPGGESMIGWSIFFELALAGILYLGLRPLLPYLERS